MQQDRSNTEPQPTEQSAGSTAPSSLGVPPQSQKQPVVTLTPDQPVATAPTQQSPQLSEESIGGDTAVSDSASAVTDEPVRWQAHEYIHREKGALWFIIFALVVIGLIAGAIFVIQSITFAILVPVMATALIVYSRRPPRLLDYTLSRQGLHINDRLYPFSDFKSFGVVHDGEEYSVMLIPIRRFHTGVSVYFPEESGEAIVDMLGARLPMEQLHLDAIDTIIRKLRI